ncbi:MAG TPA: hypothetical protein PKN96_11555 [Flavobacterium sp.]|uniref:hypothetical protein n=1 Tax=Flavobacterium sp. TaxID=239 RepID=UPI002CF104CC|nr:hypothetical protein [Flavobacterium sp.]HNP33917.1 hypothetical protein [Flavobacterium sp.]
MKTKLSIHSICVSVVKKYLILLFVFINAAAYSQLINKDSIDLTETKELLSKKQFNKIINVNFSKLITGQSTNTVGSYAAVDPEKAEATFSPNFILENGNVIIGKMTGGVTDGIYSVFNNSKLNTNISLELQYHFLNKKTKRVLRYYKSDFDKQKETDEKTEKEWKDSKAKIEASYDVNTRIIENDKLTKEDSTITVTIEQLNKKLLEEKAKVNPNAGTIELLNAQINMQKFKQKQNNDKIQENVTLNNAFNPLKERMKIGNIRADKLKENDISKLKIVGFCFSWISLAYKIKNDEFRLLDPLQPYATQITKDNYISHEFKTQYSYVNLNSDREKATYFTTSLTYKYKSNFNDLKRVEVTETKEVATNANQTRVTTEKYFAYAGKYKTDINQINLDVDFYHFPFNNSSIGYHIFPNSKYTDDIKPVYNAGFGIVFPFIDKKNDKSIINVELYYNVVNIFNSKNSDYSFIERNNIGLRIAFPISFNPK